MGYFARVYISWIFHHSSSFFFFSFPYHLVHSKLQQILQRSVLKSDLDLDYQSRVSCTSQSHRCLLSGCESIEILDSSQTLKPQPFLPSAKRLPVHIQVDPGWCSLVSAALHSKVVAPRAQRFLLLTWLQAYKTSSYVAGSYCEILFEPEVPHIPRRLPLLSRSRSVLQVIQVEENIALEEPLLYTSAILTNLNQHIYSTARFILPSVTPKPKSRAIAFRLAITPTFILSIFLGKHLIQIFWYRREWIMKSAR